MHQMRNQRPRIGLLLLLTVLGLVCIEYAYALITPYHLQAGYLLMESFVPLTYPLGYWMVRLLLTVAVLGPIGWVCALRRWRLIPYLLVGFALAMHGPLFHILIHLYLMAPLQRAPLRKG